jgi:WD40 repeat protein
MRIPFYIAGLVLFAEAANAQQPELILPIGHTEYISSTKYSPDGKYLLTCSGDNTKPPSYLLIKLHPFIKSQLFCFVNRNKHFFQ